LCVGNRAFVVFRTFRTKSAWRAWRCVKKYPLVMTNSSPWYRWPKEIDGLPMKNGDFPWQTVK
jgi:hypothetical protein